MVIQIKKIFSAHKWLYKICKTKINVCLNNNSTVIIILLIFAWILKSFFPAVSVVSLERLRGLHYCWPNTLLTSRFLQTDLTLYLKELYYGPLQLGCSFSIPKIYLILQIFSAFPVEESYAWVQIWGLNSIPCFLAQWNLQYSCWVGYLLAFFSFF